MCARTISLKKKRINKTEDEAEAATKKKKIEGPSFRASSKVLYMVCRAMCVYNLWQ